MIYCQFVSSNISIFKSTCVEHFALTVNSLITSTCIHAFAFLNIMHKIRMHAFMLLTNSSILFLYTSLYPKEFLSPPFNLCAERGGGDIYRLRPGRGLQHKDVIRLTFPLREGSARGATFCGAGTATGGLVSVVFSNMLRKAARNENSQRLICKLIPSPSQHQQQQ